jgi:hypothetical protein
MNRVRARKQAIRQVAVVEVDGRLSDLVESVDQEVQLALADGPRGVVCDLSGVLENADPVAVAALATVGRHVRDWPGTPVAVACPDPKVREALSAHPLGTHLIVTESIFMAMSAVLATSNVDIERIQLAAHPTAARASREFVTRTLLDWRLGRVIPFASTVIRELVLSSSANAGTDMELSVAWDQGALRLCVRDHGPALMGQRPSPLDLTGSGLTIAAGLSRAFGVMPAADGGKVVWAVLNATRPQLLTRRIQSEPESTTHQPPIFTDGRGLAQLPFCAGQSRQPA